MWKGTGLKPITVDINKCSGKPCIGKYRFPLAQLLAELAEDPELTLKDWADDYQLPVQEVCQSLEQLASFLDYDWTQMGNIRDCLIGD